MLNPESMKDYWFVFTVKSGEVQTTKAINLDAKKFIDGEDARPRGICVPSDNLCGITTYVQQHLFPVMKDFDTAF